MDFVFLHTLKFQISAALVLLLLLFTASIGHTLYALEQRRSDSTALNLGAKLQLTAQRLTTQGLNYLENAPRDYPTYYRDVRLYYRDVSAHIETFESTNSALMSGQFPPAITGLGSMMYPLFDERIRQAAAVLHTTWTRYRQGLAEALGTDRNEPRLEYAAQYVVKNQPLLEQATAQLLSTLQDIVNRRLEQVNLVNRIVLLLSFVTVTAIIAWFFVNVLRPLNRAVAGFRRVAQGDFGHQVSTGADNEIGWLAQSFNDLSMRLHSIFRLTDKIQRGSDLEETLRYVWEEFNPILPIDWVASLLVEDHTGLLTLERTFLDGQPEISEHRQFALEDTRLEQAMHAGSPLPISDLDQVAAGTVANELLALLARKQLRSVIFLPFGAQSLVPGTLVVATRQPNAYSAEHLELLTNIAHLVTHSIGKTVKLVEQARLASIGEFASGMVHEIRNPLTTVNLSMRYFQNADQSEDGQQWGTIAERELSRMGRLLDDILLYAKPIPLRRELVELNEVLSEFLAEHGQLAVERGQSFVLEPSEGSANVRVDRDRLTQILHNLARNACEAAPEAAVIRWIVTHDHASGTVMLRVNNPGTAIPKDVLPHLFEPFFTTKKRGTGLGLSIVHRMVEAHGGTITVQSTDEDGTTAVMALPGATVSDETRSSADKSG